LVGQRGPLAGTGPEAAAASLLTPVSLLERLRRPEDADAWQRFATLYTPLLFAWARRTGLREADAADLVQDVFAVLVGKLPEFHYRPGGSFRAWLHTVLLNKWREHKRRRTLPTQEGVAVESLPDPHANPLDAEDARAEMVRGALHLLRPTFEPTTWQAFWETAALGRRAADVAAELGLSVNAVYIARSRVLTRLRQELDGLL
jgi:RNA polymerase sigma-70 factor (ECF subfamily)